MWIDVLLYMGIGFAAQLVDGAIGMAYGLIATILLSSGLPPATASACVHAAEVFTTGASGASHWRFGNVDRDLLVRLAVPGVIGGGAGALLLSSFPGETLRPVVSAYLLVMGLIILRRAWKGARQVSEPPRNVAALGIVGGFLDAVGGGGWGPMVATTLIGRGATPRYAIGSVNLAEFFVTFTITITFLFTIGLELWPIIAGLILGGVLAAPFAAYVTQRLPTKRLMMVVGTIICALSARELSVLVR